MSKFIPLFILLLISFAKSEQLNVFAVDTTNYPTLSAKFYILDDNSQQIKNFDIEDISVSENGIERDIIDLSCPPDPEKVPYSIAMSLDISGSMEHAEQTLNALELGKITAKKLCNLLEMPPSEMALQACNDIPMIVTDFTSDKQKIFNSIDYAMVGGANDFEAHLMDEKAGLLPLAKLGKNKKMAILYTDAYYEAMETNFLQECIDYCLLNDITFYSIIYSNPSANNRGIKSSLAQLCKATGGLFIDGVYTHKIAELVAAQIQDLEPCTLTWESDYLCKSDVQELIIDIPRFGLKYTDKFYQSSRALSKLKISPGAVFFENKPLNITSDTSITVSAIGHSFNISDIILSDQAFNISPKSFSLAKGESIVLTLNFNPDKEKSYLCEINFVTDICPIRTHAFAGYTDTPDSQLELKITHPNGGEDFLIGSDTIISWEGTLPSDTVKLEYSTDNGINWSVLTDKATNGNYKWQDVPYPVSDKCLIKASKGIKIPTDNDIKKEWDLCLGGSYDDFATCIIKSQYGGYLSAGAFMNENVVAGNSYFKTDGFINKITENGILEWSITYGGEDTDQLNSADETADGGYIFAGFTYSNDGDVSGNHGGSDVWVVKTNYAGDFEWQKCFGGINDDFAEKIVRTIDNGFIIVGYTESNSDDVLGNHGKSDVWVVKLDSDGNMIWQKCLGGSENDLAYDIKQMVDGSYILVGKSASDDGDITRHITGDDVWIVKLDAVGEIIWQKTYGTIGTEALYSVSVNDEGGFYVVGRSNSHGNDFEGHFGYIDIIAIKLDQNGNMIWQKCFGGKMDDTALSVKTTVDNGLIIAGTSESRNGNVTDNKGEKDFWILKLVSTGEIQWKKSFGGSDREEAYEILQTEDYGFVVAGMTRSSDGDVSEDPGIGDAWIIKLSKDSFPTYQEDNSDNWFSVSIPKVVSRDIDLGDALVGKRKDTLVSNLITNVSNWDCDILEINISGADAAFFDINGPLAPYKVNKNGSQHTEFRFSPNSPRYYHAKLQIITPIDTLYQNIIARGVKIQIESIANVIDFGEHSILGQVDTNMVMIKNASNIPMKITKIEMLGPDTKQFIFKDLSQTQTVTLQPDEEFTMDLRFKPIYLGRTTGRVAFYYDAPGSPSITYLYGKGNGTTLIASKDSCKPGEHSNIIIDVKDLDMEIFAQHTKSFECVFKIRNNILAPKDRDIIFEHNNDSLTLKINGNIESGNQYIAIVPMIATLGDIESTDINIDYIKFFDSSNSLLDYDIQFQNGYFKLIGLCREGGTRFINPDGIISIRNLSPNPANEYIKFDLHLIEKGYTEITLADMEGRNIKTLFVENVVNFGVRKINCDISDVNPGNYLIVLRTPSYKEHKSLVIIR